MNDHKNSATTTDSLKDLAVEVKDKAIELKDRVKDTVIDGKDQVIERTESIAEKLRTYTMANPFKAVAIAFAVGYFGMRVTRPLRWL